MNIEFLEKDNNFQNETTTYWFEVDGENYAVVESSCPINRLKLLDCDGCPIDACNDHDNMLEALMPHYKKHIND